MKKKKTHTHTLYKWNEMKKEKRSKEQGRDGNFSHFYCYYSFCVDLCDKSQSQQMKKIHYFPLQM